MPDGVHWTQPNGGFFIWLSLPKHLKSNDVTQRAKEIGVMILSGDPFFAEEPNGQFLRLAFSYVTPAEIAEGIEKLGKALVTGC